MRVHLSLTVTLVIAATQAEALCCVRTHIFTFVRPAVQGLSVCAPDACSLACSTLPPPLLPHEHVHSLTH